MAKPQQANCHLFGYWGSKWKSEQTRAPAAADIYIRLYVLNHLHAKDKEFRAFYNTISPESLSKHKHAKQSLISINIGEDLKSA